MPNLYLARRGSRTKPNVYWKRASCRFYHLWMKVERNEMSIRTFFPWNIYNSTSVLFRLLVELSRHSNDVITCKVTSTIITIFHVLVTTLTGTISLVWINCEMKLYNNIQGGSTLRDILGKPMFSCCMASYSDTLLIIDNNWYDGNRSKS